MSRSEGGLITRLGGAATGAVSSSFALMRSAGAAITRRIGSDGVTGGEEMSIYCGAQKQRYCSCFYSIVAKSKFHSSLSIINMSIIQLADTTRRARGFLNVASLQICMDSKNRARR